MTLLGSKKILFVISTLWAGGAERALSDLANAWAMQGIRIGVLTCSEQQSDHYRLLPQVERITINGIRESRNLLQRLTNNVPRLWKIRKAVRSFAPDVVVSFMDYCNVLALLALSGSGIPLVVSERTNPRCHGHGRAFEAVRRWLYPFARRLVVQTENVAKDWAYSVVSPRKVAVIPNLVREMPGITSGMVRDANLILAVGRLSREKGFDVLFAAFAHSGLAVRGARLVVLGDGPERASLEALARSLGIDQSVSMPSIVSDPESWMARCALFAMTSRFEGFPNALLEAMSLSCAVLAADCDNGPREMIRHEYNGLLVPVGDVEATAQAMKKLFDDPALRVRLGEAAAEVRERFSREKVMHQWENVIVEALRQK